MSATLRYNGDYGNFTQGSLFSVVQLKAFVVTVKDKDGSAVNCSAEDTDGAGEVDQAVALIIKECQPLMYEFASGGSSNVIHMIVDGHAVDATTLQNRIRALSGAVNGVIPASPVTIGAGPVDVSGTTVALGSHIVVS